ncbi:unnamed protein product [Dicrocoelium dendriticum]|nr:unnamed protein product [Dicrocoelium dendriticum]
MDGAKMDSTNAIWTIPVKSACTEQIFGLLVELLGCPNEGWAKSAYYGLLDLLQHGTEKQILHGIKGGIHAFRKLFSSNPHCSYTWDGFVAGLDLFDRLLSYSTTVGKVCVDSLHLLLVPVACLYKQRRDSGGVISSKNSSQLVNNSPDKLRNADEKKSHAVAYSRHMTSHIHSSHRTSRLLKMPFEPTFYDWLRRVEATVVLIFGQWSVEHCDTLKQVKRRFPTYDSCQQAPTCTKFGGKRKSQNNTFGRQQRSVKEPSCSSARMKKPMKRQCGSYCISKDSRDKHGPILCFTGPPEERSGMAPNVVFADNFNETDAQATGMPMMKGARQTGCTNHLVENGNSDKEEIMWLRQRAVSIVGHVLRRLDASQIMTEEQRRLCRMHLVSSTMKDVSSTAELSTTANRWSPEFEDACDVIPMSELAVSQGCSINPSAKAHIQRRSSEDKAIIEELEWDCSNRAMEITDERSGEVGSSDEADISCTVESSSLITEFSGGICSHLVENLTENTERPLVLPSEFSGGVPEVQTCQYAVIGSAECFEANSDVSQMLTQYTPTLEWKILRKQPYELQLTTEHTQHTHAGRQVSTFAKDAIKTKPMFGMVWKSSNEKSSISSGFQVSTKMETGQQSKPTDAGSEYVARSSRSEIEDGVTDDSKQDGLLGKTSNGENCTHDTFKANSETSAKKAQGLCWKDPVDCNSRKQVKVKPRERTALHSTEKAIARELAGRVLKQAIMAVNNTPVDNPLIAFDETFTMDEDRDDLGLFSGLSERSSQNSCFPVRNIILTQKTENFDTTIGTPLESALKSVPSDIASSCSGALRVNSETEYVHTEVDMNSSKFYAEQDWSEEVKTPRVRSKHSANAVEAFQVNEPLGRQQATENIQEGAKSSQNALLPFGLGPVPPHEELNLLSVDGPNDKPENSIGAGTQTYPVMQKTNVTLGGLHPNIIDPQVKAGGLSCSFNGTRDQHMIDKPRMSIHTSVDSSVNPLQFIRLYVNLKARASWDESTSPCPVVIDTQMTTSSPPQLDIGNSTGSSLERLASTVCTE